MNNFDLPIPCWDVDENTQTIMVTSVIYLEVTRIKSTAKIKMYTANQEYISKIQGSLESLEIMLEQFGFVRADTGILVNINHFSHFENDGYQRKKFCFNNSDKFVFCSRPSYSRLRLLLTDKGA
ncbi:LytTR family transcriptional regulator DNA-binding domain-containing protein [Paenibacillus filicis]|uniref:LytTR family transcriptional regulator DNA-binding domain-containing protein n=1 Tax=Paenibacillus filicis TaxID=669464 RepID=A0ABU9DK60_9BACL